MKKRRVPEVQVYSIAPAAAPSLAQGRTGTLHETAKWQRDNKYILSGYRRENPYYLEILASLVFLHNETCNVYTHLVGVVLLPFVATTATRSLSQPQFLNVMSIDYTMFGIFFWSAECCLIFSAVYHLVGPHSHQVEQFWHRMDLLGIVIITVGTFIPGIYYIFICELALRILHWFIMRHVYTGIWSDTGFHSVPYTGYMRHSAGCASIALRYQKPTRCKASKSIQDR